MILTRPPKRARLLVAVRAVLLRGEVAGSRAPRALRAASRCSDRRERPWPSSGDLSSRSRGRIPGRRPRCGSFDVADGRGTEPSHRGRSRVKKVMRRRKTATATDTHLLGCHGGCHSTLAVRSLHVRVLLLSVRQDVARPSARAGSMIFTGSVGTNDESTVQQLVTFRVRSGCSASQHPVVEASTELFQL